MSAIVKKLLPINQKSFYGKAIVRTEDNGDCVLLSYNTPVCKIANGKFMRLWNGYSATTMKHINSFRMVYNFDTICKKDWERLEVN